MGGTEKKGGETKVFKRRSKLGQGVGALKMNGSCNPITKYLIHALNVLLECIETNTFFKIEEQFNDLVIDWSCEKIVKHLCKILFSADWALWAKLDTSQKNMYVCNYPTILGK